MIKHVLLTLSSIYILIEIQAWAFLSEIYRNEVSSDLLSNYELFGYASAGIGISLLLIKQASKIKNKVIFTLTVLATPVFYIIAVWGIYELVNQSDKVIPNDFRPQVLSASIKTLSTPSWNNTVLFLGSSEATPYDIKKLQSLHPTPDVVIQKNYIQGMDSLAKFNQRYKEVAEMVDRDLWPILWKKTRGVAIHLSSGELHLREVESHLDYLYNWAESSKRNPLEWLSFYSGLASLQAQNKHPFIHVSMLDDSVLQKTYIYQDEEIDKFAWELMGDSFDNWLNATSFNHESYRAAITQSTVGEYVNLKGHLIPWYTNESEVFNSQEYWYFTNQLTPFFFSEEGKPLISIRNINDRETRMRYIRRLQEGLPYEMKDSWLSYQASLLKALSQNAEKWEDKTASSIASPLLRVGIVTPLMLVLSSFLILFNSYSLWKENKLIAISSVVIGVILATGLFPSTTDLLLKTLVTISVEHPAVYLRL